MKIKSIILILLIIVLLAVGGLFWHRSTYIQIASETLRRDITELTLTGDQLPELTLLQQLSALKHLDVRNIPISIKEYEQLKAALPNCRIVWNVPFQGTYLSEDTKELTISSLQPGDLDSLRYLPALTQIHAEDCRDYDALMLLKEGFPNLELHYTVLIQGTAYDKNTEALTLHDADAAEVSAALPYLPQLQQVTFTGTAPDNEAIYQMMCSYPDVAFLWELSVFGTKMPNTATQLILSGIPMEDTSEVESYLRFFPLLERVEMCDCGISSADMDSLCQRWPDIRFVWTINIGIGKVRTDITAFIPIKLGYTKAFPFNDEDCADLKYCTDMVCLDLGHMRVKDLSFLTNMPKLKYLIVADVPCEDFSAIANLKELIYLEIFWSKFSDHSILLELPKLQDLNLSYTPVENIETLKQLTWLKRMWIAGAGITTPQLDELRAALPDTKVVTNVPHATAGGWRETQNYRDMRDLLGMGYMSE